MRLVQNGVNGLDMSDMSYVTSGYLTKFPQDAYAALLAAYDAADKAAVEAAARRDG